MTQWHTSAVISPNRGSEYLSFYLVCRILLIYYLKPSTFQPERSSCSTTLALALAFQCHVHRVSWQWVSNAMCRNNDLSFPWTIALRVNSSSLLRQLISQPALAFPFMTFRRCAIMCVYRI